MNTKYACMQLKRDAVNHIVNTLSKATLAIFSPCKIQQISAYNHSMVLIIQSYDCNQVPVGIFHAEKTAEVVLLRVFRIGLPASFLLSVRTFSFGSQIFN